MSSKLWRWAELKLQNKGCDQKVSMDAEVAVSLSKLGVIFKLKDEPRTSFEQTNHFILAWIQLVCVHVTDRTSIIWPISSHVPLTLCNASHGLFTSWIHGWEISFWFRFCYSPDHFQVQIMSIWKCSMQNLLSFLDCVWLNMLHAVSKWVKQVCQLSHLLPKSYSTG